MGSEMCIRDSTCTSLFLNLKFFILCAGLAQSEPEGCVADVGPSGAGKGRESPMVSSSRGLVAEPMASATVEGGTSAATVTEALRTDELLLEPSYCDLAKLVLLHSLSGSLLLSQSK